MSRVTEVNATREANSGMGLGCKVTCLAVEVASLFGGAYLLRQQRALFESFVIFSASVVVLHVILEGLQAPKQLESRQTTSAPVVGPQEGRPIVTSEAMERMDAGIALVKEQLRKLNVSELQTQLTDLRAKKNRVAGDLDRAQMQGQSRAKNERELEKLRQEKENLDRALSELQAELGRVDRQDSKAAREQEVMEQQHREAMATLRSTHQSKIAEIQQKIDALQAAKGRIVSDVVALGRELSLDIPTGKDRKTFCEQLLKTEQTNLKEAQEKLKTATTSAAEAKRALAKIKQELADLRASAALVADIKNSSREETGGTGEELEWSWEDCNKESPKKEEAERDRQIREWLIKHSPVKTSGYAVKFKAAEGRSLPPSPLKVSSSSRSKGNLKPQKLFDSPQKKRPSSPKERYQGE